MNQYSDQNQSISWMLCLLMLASLLFFTMPGQAQQVIGQNMSNIEIYSRCYSRLVNEPLPANDPMRTQILNNTITPVNACLALFDQAMWEKSSSALTSPEAKPIALKIIRTLHNFHRTWFQSRNYQGERTATVIADAEEAPLYITRAALQKDLKYSSVFTTRSGLMGLRYRPNRDTVTEFQAQTIVQHDSAMPYANSVDMPIAYRDLTVPLNAPPLDRWTSLVVPSSQLVQVGALYGVTEPSPIILPYVQRASVVNADSQAQVTELRTALMNGQNNLNIRAHFGGGVLGSFAFILANSNLPMTTTPYHDEINHRRLAARIYQDLLCHSNPPLLTTDVPDSVITNRKAFTASKTCMQCHYSYDPLVDGYRHIYFSETATPPRTDLNISGHSPNFVRSIASVSGSQVYNLQPPSGVWRYRPHLSPSTTAVVNLPFNSLEEAGVSISQQNDPYVCAAQRYYQFLTGIQVPLDLLPAAATNAKAQLTVEHQQKVMAYAQTLKTESVRELFKQIISSEAFRTRNYKAIVGGTQ